MLELLPRSYASVLSDKTSTNNVRIEHGVVLVVFKFQFAADHTDVGIVINAGRRDLTESAGR